MWRLRNDIGWSCAWVKRQCRHKCYDQLVNKLLQYIEYRPKHQYKFVIRGSKSLIYDCAPHAVSSRNEYLGKKGWNLPMPDYTAMRQNMVDGQVLPNQIKHKALIGALADTPREVFVEGDQKGYVYSDRDIQLGAERFLISVRVFAGLVEGLSPSTEDVALDVGCGTGYGTVILSKLCGMVVGIEDDSGLVGRASALLTELEVDNAVAVQGPLGGGFQKEAPYNVILVEGALPQVPQKIVEQLANGGRMAVVLNKGRGLYEAILITRVRDSFGSRVLFNSAVPSLPGFSATSVFAF